MAINVEKEDGAVSVCSTQHNSNSRVKNTYRSRKDHPLTEEGSRTLDRDQGTCGSMRKEKEWKRTLACKLYEERHSVDGSEGMDLLWEMYERDSIKSKLKNGNKNQNQNQNQNQKRDEEKEEICGNGHFCCLNAIEYNGRKMNLGIGRPNLGRFSKGIKGFGWLDHFRKNSKKVHNNGSNRYKYTYD